jgi:hypothetical protein
MGFCLADGGLELIERPSAMGFCLASRKMTTPLRQGGEQSNRSHHVSR